MRGSAIADLPTPSVPLMESAVSTKHSKTPLQRPSGPRRWRMFKDRLARLLISAGGLSIIVFILLIFVYLGYVVLPLFAPAQATPVHDYPAPGENCPATAQLVMDENTEIGARYCTNGTVVFFQISTGTIIHQTLALPADAQASSFATGDPMHGYTVYGMSDGRAAIVAHRFKSTYTDNTRRVVPELDTAVLGEPVRVDPTGQPLTRIALRQTDEEVVVAASTADGRLVLAQLSKETSFLDDTVTVQAQTHPVPSVAHGVDFLLLDKALQNLYVVSRDGELSHFDIRDKARPRLVQLINLPAADTPVTSMALVAGDVSLLVGSSNGTVSQWTVVPQGKHGRQLEKLRSFDSGRSPVTALAPEYNRKGFLAVNAAGELTIHHTTAHRTLLTEELHAGSLSHLAVAPRSNAALIESHTGALQFWRIENPHPEVSWSSLWGKVWYESYPEPAYIWQSSSASDDFEPKFSLVPLTFGTIKAAFYAMVVAVPLALFGALYTAQFMAPRMRRVVKPSIEVMAALPTVILGFLAGLWLAPYVEAHLPGVFTALIIVPPGLFAAAFIWSKLPHAIRLRVPDGWEAALLIPVLVALVWMSLGLSPWMEATFFGGDVRKWLTNEMGVSFDQRNAIIVGLAMGFAVVPNIFSIAEDAIFGVPKHLVQGSLALGATPWQTVVRVVLLTASPGIFSAVMIGFGRAVGETMIVLMATGNTAVMDLSPFLGMRTLSANIAVELPESEVNSTHFRVLFLAGLVLFVFTLVLNTLADMIRHRLRKRYSSL